MFILDAYAVLAHAQLDVVAQLVKKKKIKIVNAS